MKRSEIYKYCPICKERLSLSGNSILICSSCNHKIYNSPSPTVAVIIFNEQNQVLLGKRANDPDKGMWGTIGGFVDSGETFQQAALREVFEETSIKLSLNKLKYFSSYTGTYLFEGIKYNLVSNAFTYFLNFQPQLEPSDDITELKWFGKDKIPYSNLHKHNNIDTFINEFFMQC